MSILSQLPHYRNTHKSNHPRIKQHKKRIASPFPAHLPNSLPSLIPTTSTRNHLPFNSLPTNVSKQTTHTNWETQYSRLFRMQSLIGLLRSSIIVPVSLHRLVMNRMVVVKYGVGGAGIFVICLLKLSLHQARPMGYFRLLENISIGREERPYFNQRNPFSLDEIECCQYRLSLYCSIMHESLHALY